MTVCTLAHEARLTCAAYGRLSARPANAESCRELVLMRILRRREMVRQSCTKTAPSRSVRLQERVRLDSGANGSASWDDPDSGHPRDSLQVSPDVQPASFHRRAQAWPCAAFADLIDRGTPVGELDAAIDLPDDKHHR